MGVKSEEERYVCRLAWYAEKKGVETHEIPEEDSSEQAYLVYAIILTIVTVSMRRLRMSNLRSRFRSV